MWRGGARAHGKRMRGLVSTYCTHSHAHISSAFPRPYDARTFSPRSLFVPNHLNRLLVYILCAPLRRTPAGLVFFFLAPYSRSHSRSHPSTINLAALPSSLLKETAKIGRLFGCFRLSPVIIKPPSERKENAFLASDKERSTPPL